MSLYKSPYFTVPELVDRSTYEQFGASAIRYFRPEILRALDFVREFYPCKGLRSITVNAWAKGIEWRGLRNPLSPVYKTYSAHSYGAAIDFEAHGITDDEMRAWILATHEQVRKEGHLDHPILGIRRMENATSGWCHIDNFSHSAENILMVNG